MFTEPVLVCNAAIDARGLFALRIAPPRRRPFESPIPCCCHFGRRAKLDHPAYGEGDAHPDHHPRPANMRRSSSRLDATATHAHLAARTGTRLAVWGPADHAARTLRGTDAHRLFAVRIGADRATRAGLPLAVGGSADHAARASALLRRRRLAADAVLVACPGRTAIGRRAGHPARAVLPLIRLPAGAVDIARAARTFRARFRRWAFRCVMPGPGRRRRRRRFFLRNAAPSAPDRTGGAGASAAAGEDHAACAGRFSRR